MGRLEHASELYRAAHDVNAKLEEVDNNLRQATEEGEQMSKSARLTLAAKEKEQQDVQQQLQAHQTELGELVGKMERTHDKRNGLRVGRLLAWGVSFAYPPCAIVAAGMEVGGQSVSTFVSNAKPNTD